MHIESNQALGGYIAMMKDDATLLQAARKLDKDALIDIFDCYAPVLYKYALRLCRDSAEADDIVGDVFTQLLKLFKEGLGPRDNLRAYLYQIAYHKVVDHSRDRKRVSQLEEDFIPDSAKTLHAQNEHQEEMDAVEAIILNQLNEDQRQVIVLRFIENFSLKETAEIVGKNENNIKVIQNRAIARLREALGSRPEETT